MIPNTRQFEKLSRIRNEKNTLLHVSNKKSQKGTLKKIPYHYIASVAYFIGKIESKYLNTLYMDDEVENVFLPGPSISFHFNLLQNH